MNIEDMVLSLMRRAARGVFRAMPTPIQSVVKRVNLAGQRLYLRLRPPRRIAPTRAGLLALFAPLVLGIAAINAANNLLFLLLGACLGAIVLSGILSERAIRGVQAHISPVGDIRAGAPTRLLVRLERTQYSQDDPAEFGLRVRESASREARLREEALDVTLPVIDGRAARAMTTRTFPRRGRAHLETCELVTTSPFGLLSKSKDLDVECSVIVRPREVEVPSALATPSGVAVGGQSASRRGLGQDIYGLREKLEHDPAHRLHALRSLALGRDVVLETEAMQKPRAWLGVVNLEGANPEAFERAVEIAAATLLAWQREGYAVGLVTAGRSYEPGVEDLDALLDALSLVELCAGGLRAEEEPLWLVPEGAEVPRDGVAVHVDARGEARVGARERSAA